MKSIIFIFKIKYIQAISHILHIASHYFFITPTICLINISLSTGIDQKILIFFNIKYFIVQPWNINFSSHSFIIFSNFFLVIQLRYENTSLLESSSPIRKAILLSASGNFSTDLLYKLTRNDSVVNKCNHGICIVSQIWCQK